MAASWWKPVADFLIVATTWFRSPFPLLCWIWNGPNKLSLVIQTCIFSGLHKTDVAVTYLEPASTEPNDHPMFYCISKYH